MLKRASSGHQKVTRVLVPINVTNSHWYLVSISTSSGTVEVIDSLVKMDADWYHDDVCKLKTFVEQVLN